MGLLKVVIVDDDREAIESLARQVDWDKQGFVLSGMADGFLEGIRLVQKLRPDVLILDLFMPGPVGGELVREFRLLDENMRIILMSESNYFRYAHEAMRYKLFRLLSKPFSAEVLIEALQCAKAELRPDLAQAPLHSPDAVNTHTLVLCALEYMEQNFRERLTLDMLAARFYVSTWYLCKLFKKHTGMSFIDLLIRIRIRKSQELLKGTTMKVYEIADLVGYKDLAYFTALFKRTVGMRPLQYRNLGDQPLPLELPRKR